MSYKVLASSQVVKQARCLPTINTSLLPTKKHPLATHHCLNGQSYRQHSTTTPQRAKGWNQSAKPALEIHPMTFKVWVFLIDFYWCRLTPNMLLLGKKMVSWLCMEAMGFLVHWVVNPLKHLKTLQRLGEHLPESRKYVALPLRVLLMEELLYHLGCKKACKQWGETTYQLVQDFFHQQYNYSR